MRKFSKIPPKIRGHAYTNVITVCRRTELSTYIKINTWLTLALIASFANRQNKSGSADRRIEAIPANPSLPSPHLIICVWKRLDGAVAKLHMEEETSATAAMARLRAVQNAFVSGRRTVAIPIEQQRIFETWDAPVGWKSVCEGDP